MAIAITGTARAQVAGAVPATYFGLSTLNYTTDVPSIPYGLTRSWDAAGLDWADVNSFPGVYNFAALDKFITFSQANSSSILYTFGRTPRWASSQPNNILSPYGAGQCASPANLVNWDNYVRAIAIHAAGRIKYWELWNEAQNPQFYCGSVSTMVLMAQHAYTIIKSIDPTAVVLSPSVVHASGLPWLTKYVNAGGDRYADVIAFHPYTGETAEDMVSVVQSYKSFMQAHGLSAKPLWDTESSWATSGATPTLTASQEAGFIAKAYLLQWSGGVSNFTWYGYDTSVVWGQLWNSSAGLSAAGTAYTQTYNWMVGATMTSPCSEDANSIWACTLTRANGYQAQATWISNSSMSVTVPSFYTQYRDLTGGVHAITNNTVTIGDQPILLEGVATASSPAPSATGPLRSIAQGRAFYLGALPLGSAIWSGQSTTPNAIDQVFAREFNIGNYSGMKFDTLEPKPPKFVNGILQPAANVADDFNFSARIKASLDFATANGILIHAHTLLYHLSEPPWLTGCAVQATDPTTCTTPWTVDELKQILKYHIQSVLTYYSTRYPGRFLSWDIANELNYTGTNADDRRSVFEQIPDPATGQPSLTYYVELAAQYAHEADPNTMLCLNDFGNEFLNMANSELMFDYAKKLVADGTPISCIGFQAGEALPSNGASVAASQTATTRELFLETLQRYDALGLKAFLSEWEVGVPLVGQGPLPASAPPAGTASDPRYQTAQATVFAGVLDACLESPNCMGATMWGFNPIYSLWSALGPNGDAAYNLPYGYSADPNIFDANNNPKPAYAALANSMENAFDNSGIVLASAMAKQGNQTLVSNSSSPYNGFIALGAGGSLSQQMFFPSSSMYDLHVEAGAVFPSGTAPSLNLVVDGKVVKTAPVSMTQHNDLEVQIPFLLSAGNHTIMVSATGITTGASIYVDRVWYQPSAPFTQYIRPMDFTASAPSLYSIDSGNGRGIAVGNETLSVPMTVPVAGNYQISFCGYGGVGNLNPIIQLQVDGQNVNTFPLRPIGVAEYQSFAPLAAGPHTLTVVFANYVSGLTLKIDHLFVKYQPNNAIALRVLGGMVPSTSTTAKGDLMIGAGNMSELVTIPSSGTYQVAVIAASNEVTDSSNVTSYAQGQILVDGASIGTFLATSDGWQTYNLTAQLTAGPHTIAVAFANPGSLPAGGFLNTRQLAVQSVTLTPQ